MNEVVLTSGENAQGSPVTISFSIPTAIAGATMTEQELVEFEKSLTTAINGRVSVSAADPGFGNVSINRVGNDIYIKDAEGRSLGNIATTDRVANLGSGSEVTISATNTFTDSKVGVVSVLAKNPAATAVFSGSARLNDTQIKTQAGSNLAIARIDNAIANVDQERGVYGSIMNRLTYAGDNLTNISQNTSFSRSRVLDTDYAAATTELARTQIIQQAGMAMLAQANQQPQTVLSLLQ
jgi:flagellin